MSQESYQNMIYRNNRFKNAIDNKFENQKKTALKGKV